jgi:hypothetical protein
MNIFKTIGDWFLNFNGDGDAKLVLGFALIIFSCVYIAVIDKGNVPAFLAISGVGTSLLTLGVVQDKVNQSAPPASGGNPTQGVPQ